jgi:cytochrome c553
MQRLVTSALLVSFFVLAAVPAWVLAQSALRPVEDGRAAFAQVATVMQSPRCMNCHPRADRPSQGDDRQVHAMNVQRGPADRGLPAMNCVTCHQSRNNDRARVPGAPHWHLAPVSMGWTNLSVGDLCRTLLDRSKNGNRSVSDLVKHMTTDPLVLWAWEPGVGRSPPSVPRDEFKMVLELWAAAGAPCPN